MHNTVMGNNPFVNGKFNTSVFSTCWDNAHNMRKRTEYRLSERNLLIRRLAILIFQSPYGDNLKAISRKAGLGETAVRDILVRTPNPGVQTIEKILQAIDKTWEDLMGDNSKIIMSSSQLDDILQKAVLQLTTEMRKGRKENIIKNTKQSL